jgi:hypothetical protein
LPVHWLDFGDETVASPRQCLDKSGTIGVVVQGSPNLPYSKVESLLEVYKCIGAPYLFCNLLPGDNFARTADQRKKALWRPAGRVELEGLSLAPWASRRRQDLLDLLDQLTPKIRELNGKLEQIVERRPVTPQLSTHPDYAQMKPLGSHAGEPGIAMVCSKSPP